MAEVKYNIKNPGIKRLMREAAELSEATEEYSACPLEDNLFEWHFTVRGPPNTEFENGIYHGRIILPTEYPMKPPDIILLTPNGRFETNKKICLSISGHHPESWQPSWSIRTALLALIAFMPTKTTGAIGSLDYTAEERKLLARKSKEFKCPICGDVTSKLSGIEGKSTLSLAEASLINEITSLADNKNDEICEKTIKKVLGDMLPNPKETNETKEAEKSDNFIREIIRDNDDEEMTSQNRMLPFVVFFLVTAIIILIIRRFVGSKFIKCDIFNSENIEPLVKLNPDIIDMIDAPNIPEILDAADLQNLHNIPDIPDVPDAPELSDPDIPLANETILN